ncbi:MAG: alginate lyase family protein [Azospirillaceae bacterium]|nr:alginate lyase family protein [Azospirillaceae bacterium]
MRQWLASLMIGIVAATAVTGPARADLPQPLRAPFDVEAQRAARGTPAPEDFDCPAPIDAVLRAEGVSFYTDRAHSKVNEDRQRQNKDKIAPMRHFAHIVTKLSDAFVGSQPTDPRPALCALQWLDGWATAGALLAEPNQQGAYEREWTLSGIALAYLKLRGVEDPDAARKARVQTWLADLARAVHQVYEQPKRSDNFNNHAYWAGLAVAAAGVADNDQSLFTWGLSKYRLGIAQISPQGTLPLEMARRQRALHYHLFALTPLVMLAELGAANGVDLYGERNRALFRLVDRVLDGLDDRDWFADAAGEPQELAEKLPVDDIAWVVPLQARFPSDRLADLRGDHPTMISPRLGGNVTLMFGTP